jgi:hypothetical protein
MNSEQPNRHETMKWLLTEIRYLDIIYCRSNSRDKKINIICLFNR